MSVTIRRADTEWLIEVQGEPVAAGSTEAEAQELAEQWTANLKWRASCRFAPPWLDEEEYNRSAHIVDRREHKPGSGVTPAVLG
jgi:hypothetical protein